MTTLKQLLATKHYLHPLHVCDTLSIQQQKPRHQPAANAHQNGSPIGKQLSCGSKHQQKGQIRVSGPWVNFIIYFVFCEVLVAFGLLARVSGTVRLLGTVVIVRIATVTGRDSAASGGGALIGLHRPSARNVCPTTSWIGKAITIVILCVEFTYEILTQVRLRRFKAKKTQKCTQPKYNRHLRLQNHQHIRYSNQAIS